MDKRLHVEFNGGEAETVTQIRDKLSKSLGIKLSYKATVMYLINKEVGNEPSDAARA